MKKKKFTHCIITDNKNNPMAWSETNEQICYCDNLEYLDVIFPLKVVTINEAKKQIQKTKDNRTKWGFGVIDYRLYPVDMDQYLK